MLNREVNAALTDPKMRERMMELGAEPFPLSSAEFGKFIADETAKWGKVIRAANIKPE
jgi:tripartite-type tricarboxylate transporter receptor subunit TctC